MSKQMSDRFKTQQLPCTQKDALALERILPRGQEAECHLPCTY